MTRDPDKVLSVSGLSKGFTLHLHGGKRLEVIADAVFDLYAGESLVLGGPSGAGKSSLLKMIFGNYLPGGGSIRIRHEGTWIELVGAHPRVVLDVRRRTLGYVSQFLRVIPRVPTLDVVAEPALAAGFSPSQARDRAAVLLSRLNLPERLWNLPPATFSGGEQQRVNIARGFAGDHRILILDEPTASLDDANRSAVLDLIGARKAEGAAFLGIFHDLETRERVADRVIDVSAFAPQAKDAA